MNAKIAIVEIGVELKDVDAEWLLVHLPGEKFAQHAISTLQDAIKEFPGADIITFDGHYAKDEKEAACLVPILQPHSRILNLNESRSFRRALRHFFATRSVSFACYRKSLFEGGQINAECAVNRASIALLINQYLVVRKVDVKESAQVEYLTIISDGVCLKQVVKAFFHNFKHIFRFAYIPIIKRRSEGRFAKYMPTLVKRVHAAFTDAKINYVVDFGALIGFMREGWFLDRDDDVDFSILPGTSPLAVCEALEKIGFNFQMCVAYGGVVTNLKMEDKKLGVFVDLFFLMADRGKVYHCGASPKYKDLKCYGGWRYYRPAITRTIEISPRNQFKVMVPENYDEFLRAHYGNWRIPNRNWTNDDANADDPETKVPTPEYAYRIYKREDLVRVVQGRA